MPLLILKKALWSELLLELRGAPRLSLQAFYGLWPTFHPATLMQQLEHGSGSSGNDQQPTTTAALFECGVAPTLALLAHLPVFRVLRPGGELPSYSPTSSSPTNSTSLVSRGDPSSVDALAASLSSTYFVRSFVHGGDGVGFGMGFQSPSLRGQHTLGNNDGSSSSVSSTGLGIRKGLSSLIGKTGRSAAAAVASSTTSTIEKDMANSAPKSSSSSSRGYGLVHSGEWRSADTARFLTACPTLPPLAWGGGGGGSDGGGGSGGIASGNGSTSGGGGGGGGGFGSVSVAAFGSNEAHEARVAWFKEVVLPYEGLALAKHLALFGQPPQRPAPIGEATLTHSKSCVKSICLFLMFVM